MVLLKALDERPAPRSTIFPTLARAVAEGRTSVPVLMELTSRHTRQDARELGAVICKSLPLMGPGGVRALAELASAKDGDPTVRFCAVEAMAQIADRKLVDERLLTLLKDLAQNEADASLREMAGNVLLRLDYPWAMKAGIDPKPMKTLP
jgi:hypothetical protein